MNLDERPRLEKGVRLHYDREGAAMLLVPEGALMLNAVAASALSLVDGKRTVGEIVSELTSAYDVATDRAYDDVGRLFERLCARRLLST